MESATDRAASRAAFVVRGAAEPPSPTLETAAAAHIAAIVSALIRRGVSQSNPWLCIHVRNPDAADAAAIAQPAHIRRL